MGAMAQLQGSDVGVGLVGEEHPGSGAPSASVKDSCASGRGPRADRSPGVPHRPARELVGVRFGNLGAWAWLTDGLDGGLPGLGSHRQHGGADALVSRQADREAHAALP